MEENIYTYVRIWEKNRSEYANRSIDSDRILSAWIDFHMHTMFKHWNFSSTLHVCTYLYVICILFFHILSACLRSHHSIAILFIFGNHYWGLYSTLSLVLLLMQCPALLLAARCHHDAILREMNEERMRYWYIITIEIYNIDNMHKYIPSLSGSIIIVIVMACYVLSNADAGSYITLCIYTYIVRCCYCISQTTIPIPCTVYANETLFT